MIVFDLFLPNRKPFVSQIDLKERGKGLLGTKDLKIPIRDEAGARFERLVEAHPFSKRRLRDGNRLKLQSAINVVDAKLMNDKEIGDKDLVLRSSRATKWYVHELGTGW